MLDGAGVRCNGSRTPREYAQGAAWFRMSSQSRHSERTVRTNRSATPLACGVRNGVRTISIPSLRNTSSNPSVNFWSRSRIRKRTGSGRSRQRPSQLAGALDDPRRTGMRCASGQVHATAAQLDEEEDVEPLQPQRLHRKEIDGQQAVPVCAHELAPGDPSASPTAQDPRPSATSAPSSRRPACPGPSTHQQSVDSPTADCLARDGARGLESLVASVVGLRDARRSTVSRPTADASEAVSLA